MSSSVRRITGHLPPGPIATWWDAAVGPGTSPGTRTAIGTGEKESPRKGTRRMCELSSASRLSTLLDAM